MLVHATVQVRVLPEVLDPQGVAVGETLRAMGFGAVADVRIGRLIELRLDTDQSDEPAVRAGEETALRRYVLALCRALLVHEVVETAEVVALEVVPSASPEGHAKRKGT
jgi:phosphoribosylformylglycinamidine synthase subunit PurS